MNRIRRLLLVSAAGLLLDGCAAAGPALNSDRIEEKFGSYGVDVIVEDDRRRVSSLYSGSGVDRVTRTYALVEFLGDARPEFSDEHAAVMRGASIGETFRRSGWSIRKQTLFIGELEVPAAYTIVGNLMQIELPDNLAVHQYLFVISREERSFSYARITEVHHPEFATQADLQAWYGEIILDDSNRDSIHDFLGPPAAK
ncbi:MAG: hypothetical protein OEM63_01040 [Gammaproteobacteria bacterium]|nr:hypothetical protein [Gammaproteobacteria bacterium]